jgi:hypothetical protein
MATKILDISDYGYKGKTVSVKEPTGADMIAVNDFMIKDRKAKGEANTYMASLILLNRVITEAPFDNKIDTLKSLPTKLLTYLSDEVGKMMSPLPKKEETASSETTDEESSPTI